MRIERDRSGSGIGGPGPPRICPHYPLMAQMQAIKNAQCKYGGLLYVRVFSAVEYLHPLVAEVLCWHQIVSHIIGDGRIEWWGFGRISGGAEACEVGLGVVLIAVAEIFGHVDELDIF